MNMNKNMNMNKEKWVNEVINSLDDIQSAEVNPFLYSKIISRIETNPIEATPLKLVWLAAASFTILIVLNFQAIKINNSSSKTATTTAHEIASQYNMSNTNSISYN